MRPLEGAQQLMIDQEVVAEEVLAERERIVKQQCSRSYAREEGSNRALPGLLWANPLGHLVFPNGLTDKIGEDIARPDHDHKEDEHERACRNEAYTDKHSHGNSYVNKGKGGGTRSGENGAKAFPLYTEGQESKGSEAGKQCRSNKELLASKIELSCGLIADDRDSDEENADEHIRRHRKRLHSITPGQLQKFPNRQQ